MSDVIKMSRKGSETNRSFKQTSSVTKGRDTVAKRTHIKTFYCI